MKKQRGFTLIELIVVILILGVLGAYAAPKFMGLDVEARRKVMQSLESTVRTANEMVHSMAVLQGKDVGADYIVTPDEDKIRVNNGYATAASISIYNDKGILSNAAKQLGDTVFRNKYLGHKKKGERLDGGIGAATEFDGQQVDLTCENDQCVWAARIPDNSRCFVSYTYDGNGTPVIDSDFSDCQGRTKAVK